MDADEAEDREIAELNAIMRREDEDDIALMSRLGAYEDAELDALREDPYRELADFMRGTDESEEAIYEALLRLSEERHDDAGEVFGILYGDGSVKGPSEVL